MDSLHPGDLIHTAWIDDGVLRHGWAQVIGVDDGALTLAPLDGPGVVAITMASDAPVVVAA